MLSDGWTTVPSSLNCKTTCLLVWDVPFSRDCIGTYLNAIMSALIFTSTDDPNFKEITGYAGNSGSEPVTVEDGPGGRSPGNAAAGTTSQSSSSLSGRAAEAEAVGWGRRVANSLRRPDNTLSVTRSTRASSLVGVVLLPASALDVAVAVAARRSKTAPGRLERLEVRVFGML